MPEVPLIAVDWGAPFAPKHPKPHVAAVRASDVRIVKFNWAAELAERSERNSRSASDAKARRQGRDSEAGGEDPRRGR